MLSIRIEDEILRACADRYQLEINLRTGLGSLRTGAGRHLFDLPFDAKVIHAGGVTQVVLPYTAQIAGAVATLSSGPVGPWAGQNLRIEFSPDWFEMTYAGTVAAGQNAAVKETRYFLREKKGMQLKYCREGLQPAPEPLKESDESYQGIFPCCSAGSHFTPPPLVLFQHLPAGWVGMGLSTLPNAKKFELESTRCLFVDNPAGHLVLVPGRIYTGPSVMFIFPEDGWSGLRLFHDTLVSRGKVDGTPIWERNYPDWWKQPIYCTYGDQLMELQDNEYTTDDWGAPGYNEGWVRKVVLRAEERLQYAGFTVLIDAFWQRPWDGDPKPSERFANLRGLIDWLHGRGHRVMLWMEPFGSAITEGRGLVAARHDMLQLHCRPERAMARLDFTSAGFEAYAEELARIYFGKGDGALDADGLKMDGLASVREPKDAVYRRPESGMGISEVMRFLTVFVATARRVRPDVAINFSAADPRFAPWITHNRLHDIHSSWQERDRRARISAQAAPNLIMDTDAFVMYSHWLEPTYLNTAIIGTQTIGYTELIHDGVRLSDKTMATLGKLAQLSAQRPWGQPEFVEYGHWRLWHKGRIVGETFGRKALMLFTNEKKGHVLTFEDVEIGIQTYGRTIKGVSPVPARLVIEGDRVRALWQGGQVYELDVAEVSI